MLNYDICGKCHADNKHLMVVHKHKDNEEVLEHTCWLIGGDKTVFPTDSPPKDCPHKFEHAVYEGMKNAQ
jgi:hypothetical protein